MTKFSFKVLNFSYDEIMELWSSLGYLYHVVKIKLNNVNIHVMAIRKA